VSEEPGLFAWIDLLRRRFRFLAVTGVLAGVLTLGLALLLPKWYTGRARILPPREAPAPFFSPAALEAAVRMDNLLPFSAGVTLSDVYLGILESDTVARTLIERFDLQEVYGQGTVVKTEKALRAATRITAAPTGIIVVQVEDKDPRRAADLANAYVDELNRVYRNTRSTAGERQRAFLEVRLAQSGAALDSIEAVLTARQQDVGMAALNRDLSEAAGAAGGLIGRSLALKVERQLLDRMGIGDSPVRREVEAELLAVERQVALLPELGLDMARLLRDLRIQEVLHESLATQLEAARIEEVRDTPVVEVLDRAVPPDRHTRPRKGLVTVAGALLGSALAFAWSAYRERA
jgi:uncharacterized protein involved in exopolysaccharide biosynthesis